MGWEVPEGGPGLALQGCWYSGLSLGPLLPFATKSPPTHTGRIIAVRSGSFRPASYSLSNIGPPSSFLPIAPCGTSFFIPASNGWSRGKRRCPEEEPRLMGDKTSRQTDGQNSESWIELRTSGIWNRIVMDGRASWIEDWFSVKVLKDGV